MSYAISKTGASKAIVLALVKQELENVVAQQPIHAADQAQALAAVEAFVAIIPEPNEKQDVAISMNGSVSWNGGTSQPAVVTGASVGVNAYLVAKKEEKRPQGHTKASQLTGKLSGYTGHPALASRSP